MSSTPRSWLYVPGHRPERVAKALASQADAVVVDLEDAVPADRKDAARDVAVGTLAERRKGVPGPQVWVRVNSPATPEGRADIAAMTGSGADGLRLPRVEDADVVRDVADATRLPLQLLLETALGLARASELATAHPLVGGIGLGEADLAADLLVDRDEGLRWARGAVVVAARAAGLPSPVQSVWTDVADVDGLRTSSLAGRAAGFHGRSVVHPAQLPVVHEVFTPTPAEVEAALGVLRTAEEAAGRGEVAVLDAAGRFVDPAVVHRARVVLDRVPAEPAPTPGGDE